MVNFIIYEDDKNTRQNYISVIIKIMGNLQDQYSIIELDKYNSKVMNTLSMIGKKIYILDVEVPGKSGLDLARDIREMGDWDSQIIIVTNHDSLQQTAFTSRLLTLDFISKFSNSLHALKKALITSYIIVTKDKALKVQHDGEYCQFYYNDILYIKKEVDDIDTKVVLTDGSTKNINIRLKEVEEKLKDDPRFFRTHRSCIVNTFKIRNVDFGVGIIDFGKIKINLLSRDKKKEFKKILNENEVINMDNKVLNK